MKKFNNIKISYIIMISTGAIFVLAAALSIILVQYSMHQLSLIEAEAKAKILLDRNMATHTYFSKIMKPKLLEWTAPYRSKDYFEPSWMSSTYALREIHKYFSSLTPASYYIKDAAINARSPENNADDSERAFLEKLRKDDNLESYSEIRTIDGHPYLAVMRKGEVVEESCLLCHDDPGGAPKELVRLYGPERSFQRKIGDIISVISMRIPLSDAYAGSYRTTLQISISLVFALVLLFGVQFFLFRRFLISPLGVIRDKALAIAESTEQLGENIPAPAGREFKELTDAFNGMSQRLQISMDHLEDRVAQRTLELKASHEELERDITDRKRAEEMLRESKERFQLAIDATEEGLWEWNIQTNQEFFAPRWCEIIGYSVDDPELHHTFESWASRIHPDDYDRVMGALNNHLESCAKYDVDYRHRHKSGEYRWQNSKGKAVFDESGKPIKMVGCISDIMERKLAEEKIKASLREKETMLNEIHHRVKNNLQVISSLLSLQSSYLQDEKAKEALEESGERVKTMASVHTHLYESQDLTRVDCGSFIQELVGNISQSYGRAESPVEINVDAGEISLGIDNSIPCGLILNELVSNALKHAFPEGKEGEINIRMRSEDNRMALTVQDNGIGFPESMDLTKVKSMGLELVNILVGQIGGKIDMQVDSGTTWTITFPVKRDREWRNG